MRTTLLSLGLSLFSLLLVAAPASAQDADPFMRHPAVHPEADPHYYEHGGNGHAEGDGEPYIKPAEPALAEAYRGDDADGSS